LQQQARLTEIELDRLDECQTLAMAEYLAEGRLTPNLAVRLYQETEGNPFFVVEMVRAAIHQNGLEGKASLSLPVLEQEILPLPIKIQAVLQDRLALLSRSARDLAQIAAVMGWQISYQDLRQASEMGENELVETLDELCQRRILIEDGPSTYAFSHSQLQRYIFNNLSAARRRMLQCRVGSLDVQIAP
jgi:predicted ATPase